MVCGFVQRSRQMPTWRQIEHAVKRNFDGLDNVDPMRVFDRKIQNINKDAEV